MSSGRIIVFDVETTGTDLRRDQIIELCVQFGLEVDAARRTWRVKPSVAITPGAHAVHGISAGDLSSCPSFGDADGPAAELRDIFAAADLLVGYNLRFDIEMIQAEYDRLRQPRIDLTAKQIIDPFRLWQECEPRTLQAAHRRFVGDGFAAAHSASADVAATGRVLRGMMSVFGFGAEDLNAIARLCQPRREGWIGPSHHLRWGDDGTPVIAFGEHRGTALPILARDHRDYLEWLLAEPFPVHVHEICRQAAAGDGADLERWIVRRFGPPADASPAPDGATCSSAARRREG